MRKEYGRMLVNLKINEWVKIDTPSGEIKITRTESGIACIVPMVFKIHTERLDKKNLAKSD